MGLHRTLFSSTLALTLLGSLCSYPTHAQDADSITPGEFLVNNPTLINLGFEWHVAGDSNRNAAVTVSFRKAGDGDWQEAMPMLRLHGEVTFQENIWNMVAPNMFAGSILDLEEGTVYEARFEMSDPDGVNGTADQTVTVSTRTEPMPAAGGAGDTAPGGRPRVKPGDIILMHAGTYAYYYEFYANNTRYNATTTFEGTHYL